MLYTVVDFTLIRLPASFGKPQQSVASAKCGELVGEPSKSSVAEGVVPSTRSKGKHKAQN